MVAGNRYPVGGQLVEELAGGNELAVACALGEVAGDQRQARVEIVDGAQQDVAGAGMLGAEVQVGQVDQAQRG